MSVISFKAYARVCVCYHREAFFRGDCVKQEENHNQVVRVYKLMRRVTVMESYFKLFLFACFFFFKEETLGRMSVKDCPFYAVGNLLLNSTPSSDKRGRIASMNSHFLNLKAHTQCCSHCLNFKIGHITTATVFHPQNIVLILDTHKGESDLNSRQFRISNSETDILARYNIEQIKGLQ